MASKKKLPRSRRCKNNDKLGLYCACEVDYADNFAENVPKCCRPIDAADRAVRLPSVASDRPDNALGEPCVVFEDDRKHRRDLPTREIYPETDIVHRGPPFKWIDILIGLSSIVFFYFDIITDILLARDYYHSNFRTEFILTAVFVVFPSLITSLLNFRWYLLDYQSQQIQLKNMGEQRVKLTSRMLWIVRFVMTLTMMGPVIRQIEYIYNGVKSTSKQLKERERKRHYVMMRMEDVDACCIRMFECFLEAAPQLVLQLYIMMHHSQDEETWYREVIRAAAIVSSWVSLSWSMVSYQKALRFSHEDKANISLPGVAFYFLWRAFEIGPRVIALGLFAAQFHYIVFIVVGVHWMIMSAWLFCQKTRFYQNRCEERFFNIVCGYVLVFCFLNVRDGRTRYRMLLYYTVAYLENWAMMGFWFYFTDDKSRWFYIPTFFVIVLGIVFQLFFQLVYYGCFHPLGRCQIPCCPPSEDYLCFQSLCHSLDDEPGDQYVHNTHTTAAV